MPLRIPGSRFLAGARNDPSRRIAAHPRCCALSCNITAIIAAAVLALTAPRAGALAGTGKAVVVVLHGVSWEELAAAKVPALQDLLRRSALGAMNSRVLGEPGWDSAYVTIGAGRGAVGNVGSEATPPPGYWIALDGIYDRASTFADIANWRAHTQATPGLLGATLRSNSLRSSLEVKHANEALPTPLPNRERIKERVRGGAYLPSPGRPSADRPLPDRERNSLRVLDLVDFLARRRTVPAPGSPDPQAVALLRSYEPVFAGIARWIDPARDLVIVVSPTCPSYGAGGRYVAYAPIAVSGPGIRPGLLTSASTRRLGMVSNTDIAPTILRFFRLETPSAMSGHVISAGWADHPLDRVLTISRRGMRLCELQWRLGPVYGASQFAAFTIIGGVLMFAPAWAARRRRRLQLVLLLAMSLPLALLVLGALDTGGVVRPYVLLVGLAAAFTWFAFAGAPAITALAALLTATSATMLLDLVTGRHLLDGFILNFGAYGTRLYGLHNESMGALVACAVVGGTALLQQVGQSRRSLWALGIWLTVIPVVVAAPFWGANWGGGVTAGFAGMVAYLGIRAGGPRLRHWAGAVAAAVAAGVLAIGLDLLGNPRGWTHIGESAHLVSTGGWPALWDVIARKAAGNLRVIAWAPYALTALVLIVVVAWLVLRPPARLRAALQSHPALWGGLAGGTAGAVMAVIVNDSGVVAASTALGIIACSLAYVALEGIRTELGGRSSPPLQCGGEPR